MPGTFHDLASAYSWISPLSWADRAFNQGRGTERFSNWVQEQADNIGGGLGLADPKLNNPNAGNIDMGAYNASLGGYNAAQQGMQGLAGVLTNQMNGNGPSLAQGQLQRATDSNVRNAMALGAAQQAQGLGGAAALRSIANNQARAQQEAAGQSALIRNKEMMDAQNQLGSLYGNMGSLGLGASGQMAGLLGSQAGNDLERERIFQQMWNNTYGRRANVLSAGAQGAQQAGMAIGTGGASIPGQVMSQGMSSYTNGMGTGPKYELAQGGMVPGMAHGGDSYRNDTVPAMLSPGEIVLPRSVTQGEDAPELAKEFVEAIKRHKPKATKKRPSKLEGK